MADKTLVMVLDKKETLDLVREQLGSRASGSKSHRKDNEKGKLHKTSHKKSTLQKPKPIWKGYQVIGDSMLGRLARHVGITVPFNRKTHRKEMGLVVHGQTTARLTGALHRNPPPLLASKAIVLIGTNDVKQDVRVASSVHNIKRIMSTLSRRCKQVIMLTLPPVPGKELSFSKVTEINNAIKEHSVLDCKNVKVLDLSTIFGDSEASVKLELFEKTYQGSQATDLVHWNKEGIRQVIQALETLIQ